MTSNLTSGTNTLNSKGHKIFFICFLASKIRELNLLVMVNKKISLQISLKITTPVIFVNNSPLPVFKIYERHRSGQNIFLSPTSYEVVMYVI